MGIDIDSFLDKFNLDEEKKENKTGENILNKLDFQKDVEENLVKIEKKASSSEFDVLKNIYSHVKNFDSDLTSKFLDISSGSKSILKNLGDNYSDGFYQAISNNVSIIEKELNLKIEKLNSSIQTNDFNLIFNLFNELLLKLNSFPEEFYIKKIQYFEKIKLIEIKIFDNLNLFKKKDLIELKTQIKNLILTLNKSLKLKNITKIKNNINNLNHVLKKVPVVFTSEIILERTASAKIILKAENFIKNELEEDFKSSVDLIVNLFTKFQKAILDRNLNSTITIYDEILIEFNSLPQIFLKEKIELFKEINIMYGSINDLLLKNRATMFLESYNYSKILEEIRDYLNQVKRIGRVDIKILNQLKAKLIIIPDKFSSQRDELLGFINLFLNRFEKTSLTKSQPIPEEEIETKHENKINTPIEKTKRELFEEKLKDDENKLKNHKPEFEEEIESKKKNTNTKKNVKSKPSNNNNNRNINNNNFKKIEEEINKYFLIIKDSDDVLKIKTAYKKVLFYIDLLQISDNKKTLMKDNIKKIIKNKKFT